MYEQKEKIPEVKYSTLRNFSTLQKFLDFMKGILIDDVTQINQGEGTYKSLWDSVINDIEQQIANRDLRWLGEPMPTDLEDALARERYQLMDDYQNIFETVIKPRVQELLKNSKGEFDLPVMKYNDRSLGVFDFNRASAGLRPQNKYYSIKKKEFVEPNEVKTIKEGSKYKYVLNSDKSKVALVPKIKSDDKKKVHEAYNEIADGADVFVTLKKYGLKIGGSADAFTSNIKKTYLLKEVTPKPKNAIRLFVKIGCASIYSAEQYKWTGYAAIGIAQLLSTLGYAVNIIGIYGMGTNINIDGKLNSGYRYYGINLKSFEETIDSGSILYTLSDATFFRIKFFELIVKSAFFYNDYIGVGLGYVADIFGIEDIAFKEYGKRDGMFHKNGKLDSRSQFLYYTIADIYSEQDLNKAILEIGLNVVNKNKEAAANLQP